MPYKDKHKQLVRILATGHGCRQMCRVDRFGFPPTGPKQRKRVKGFQTGGHVLGDGYTYQRRKEAALAPTPLQAVGASAVNFFGAAPALNNQRQ